MKPKPLKTESKLSELTDKETLSSMSIQQIISVLVVVDEIAKYLIPKDLLSARLVCKDWTSAFEKAFVRTVPVILDDLDLKAFIFAEGGDFRSRRMKHEAFHLLLRMTSSRRVQAMLDFCDKFGPQIKKLHVLVVPSPEEMRGLSKVLTALKENLEKLTVRLKDEEDDDEDELYEFPVMLRLKSLSFTLERDPDDDENDHETTVEGEKCLVPLIVSSCPNLEHLRIRGFPDLQKETFKKLKETRQSLRLKSLCLEECPVDAMKNLTEITFTPPLKHLRLLPSCEDMHSAGHIADYALPLAINGFLGKVAKDLISLDLRLKTVFEEEMDEELDPNPDQELPTLPSMPKLRSLTLAAIEPGDYDNGFDTDRHLELRFDYSHDINRPLLRHMYPELIELRLINTEEVDLTDVIVCPDCPHENVKRLVIVGVTDRSERRREFGVRDVAKGFPNADVVFR